jgi:hypothetical protein
MVRRGCLRFPKSCRANILVAVRLFYFYPTAALPQGNVMGLLLLIILILLLVGGLPTWGHSQNWGYGPSGLVGTLLVVLLVLIIFTDVIHISRF